MYTVYAWDVITWPSPKDLVKKLKITRVELAASRHCRRW